MANLFYLHWNREECQARVRALEAQGHTVAYHWSTDDHMQLGDFTPDVVILSLDRLPSHSRAIAEWWQEAKKRRAIPLIFAGGKPDKVEATRAKFPNAIYCPAEELDATVATILNKESSDFE